MPVKIHLLVYNYYTEYFYRTKYWTAEKGFQLRQKKKVIYHLLLFKVLYKYFEN